MTTRLQKVEMFQKSLLEHLVETNAKLDKICSLLISNQLLQECVSPEGEARTAMECAEIVMESYCAGMCLSEDLNDRSKEFDYQKSEFFIDEEDDEDSTDNEEEEEDDDDDNSLPPNFPSMTF
jgi:hypothetical protein